MCELGCPCPEAIFENDLRRFPLWSAGPQTTTPRAHSDPSYLVTCEMDAAPAPLPLNPLQLVVQTSPPPRDRGVYTTGSQVIPAGSLVEESPVLVFSKEEWEDRARHTLLQHYTFVWGKQGSMAIALGMGECSVCFTSSR